MFPKRLVGLIAVLIAGSAEAGARINLVPQDSPTGYGPGDTVRVDVFVESDRSSDVSLRLLQFDTTLTDSALALTGDLAFDLSDLSSTSLYNIRGVFPRPSMTYVGTAPIPGFMKVLPGTGGGMMNAGHLSVVLPNQPGRYLLDVINARESNPNRGAIIGFGFGVVPSDPITFWRGNTGDLTSGIGLFEMMEEGQRFSFRGGIPEPASLMLILTGAGAAVARSTFGRRRERASAPRVKANRSRFLPESLMLCSATPPTALFPSDVVDNSPRRSVCGSAGRFL